MYAYIIKRYIIVNPIHIPLSSESKINTYNIDRLSSFDFFLYFLHIILHMMINSPKRALQLQTSKISKTALTLSPYYNITILSKPPKLLYYSLPGFGSPNK